MPIIEAGDARLKSLKGLHLWHGDMSNCSQRVRIALAEKGLAYESHFVDLGKNEHATAEFQAINPKGVVPVLVHDGVVINESVDIIDHLDEAFPEPPLRPKDGAGREAVDHFLATAAASQPAVKVLSFEFLFRARGTPPQAAVEAFARSHRVPEIVAFRREFADPAGFARERVDAAVDAMDADLRDMDAALAKSPWLAGAAFSLADIAWMPNVHRVALIRWPFERYEHLAGWYDRVRARPSFKTALVDWEPEEVRTKLLPYVEKRAAAVTDVRHYGALAGAAR